MGGASGDMYTPVCKRASHWALLYDAGIPRWCSMTPGKGGAEGGPGRGDTRVLTADPHCCVAEGSTGLSSGYRPTKNNFFKKHLQIKARCNTIVE